MANPSWVMGSKFSTVDWCLDFKERGFALTVNRWAPTAGFRVSMRKKLAPDRRERLANKMVWDNRHSLPVYQTSRRGNHCLKQIG